MPEIKPRSRRPALLLAGLCVLFAGCKSEQANTPPGDDDDRPITMEGTSFKVSWFEKAGESDNGFENKALYKHSKNATANWVECNLGPGSPAFQVLRKVDNPLIVSLYLKATKHPMARASTGKNGKQLRMKPLNNYTDNGNLAGHPDSNAKVQLVVLDNVALVDGFSLPEGCEQEGDSIVCDTSEEGKGWKPKVTIHVCKGTGCKDPAP